MKVNIGGDRVGTGAKMTTELKNYYRSTHNLSTKTRTTFLPGALIPTMVLIGTRGDKFEIDLDTQLRTRPTVAPLFGSFKLQTDVYVVPFRLYQALLHNNPTDLGMKMDKVMLPMVNIRTKTSSDKIDIEETKFSSNCLIKYCGMSGLGAAAAGYGFAEREILAVPMLAYYDICKNYYANKQEENAYVITPENANIFYKYENIYMNDDEGYDSQGVSYNDERKASFYFNMATAKASGADYLIITIDGCENINNENVDVTDYEDEFAKNIFITLWVNNQSKFEKKSVWEWRERSVVNQYEGISGNNFEISIDLTEYGKYAGALPTDVPTTIECNEIWQTNDDALHLTAFPLKNIDEMRMEILSHHELGVPFRIKEENAKMPYKALVARDINGMTYNKYHLNGLCVKTYMSDLYNNWINKEFIEGENGISALTKVNIEDGGFTIDSLLFAKKLYNLYNRIAVSGATYYDWQNVTYEESDYTHVESPIYAGGYATEVVFEEIIQTTPTDGNPLGTLGGRGRNDGKKGGHIVIKCDEVSVIMAITSITPRVSYYQGNEFYMTELKSIDDLHKPALDGIGFQDLMGERLAYWDTLLAGGTIARRGKVGKVPAWIEYMTNIDRAYGEFIEEDKAEYMVLTRKYHEDETTHGIKDATTYIDPTQYNYAFAYTSIDAQNFWLQCNASVKKRGLISAKIIPQA